MIMIIVENFSAKQNFRSIVQTVRVCFFTYQRPKLYICHHGFNQIKEIYLKSLGQPLSNSISITFFSLVVFLPLQPLHLFEWLIRIHGSPTGVMLSMAMILHLWWWEWCWTAAGRKDLSSGVMVITTTTTTMLMMTMLIFGDDAN